METCLVNKDGISLSDWFVELFAIVNNFSGGICGSLSEILLFRIWLLHRYPGVCSGFSRISHCHVCGTFLCKQRGEVWVKWPRDNNYIRRSLRGGFSALNGPKCVFWWISCAWETPSFWYFKPSIRIVEFLCGTKQSIGLFVVPDLNFKFLQTVSASQYSFKFKSLLISNKFWYHRFWTSGRLAKKKRFAEKKHAEIRLTNLYSFFLVPYRSW